MSFPVFASGDVLNASDMNGVGLWLVKSQAVGSGVSSVVVTGAFSADYDNYRIVISGGVTSANGSVSLKLNNSSGTTYRHFGYFGSYGTATLTAYAPAFGTSWTDAAIGGTAGFVANIDLSAPFLSQATFGTTWTTSTNTVYNFALIDTSTASSTGFTISPVGAGVTLTGGTIRVYGYRN